MRILVVNEDENENKHDQNKSYTNESHSKLKRVKGLLIIIATVVIIIFAWFFVSPFAGSMFNPYIRDRPQYGWATLNVTYISLDGELNQYEGDCAIDLYYGINQTKYREDLTLQDFPLRINITSNLYFQDLGNFFESQYFTLFTNPEESSPYINQLVLRRELNPEILHVKTTIINYTYSNYSNINFLEPEITYFQLEFNHSNPTFLNFGQFSPYLVISISNLPMGYSWGSETIIPPDIFEQNQDSYPIAYQNDYNRKGLFLGFDTDINLSIYLYGAEGSKKVKLQTFSINISEGDPMKRIWITQLGCVDVNEQFWFQFDSSTPFSEIFLWSGSIDDYNSSYYYNSYQEVKQ
jgi:hypothetical protein